MIAWHQSDTESAASTIAHHLSDGMLRASSQNDTTNTPQFPRNEIWNKCIALCPNNGLQIPCDAIVRATDENLSVTFQDPTDLLDQAGKSLRDELVRLADCPTGDVRVTGAFDLQFAKRIIHAVPPLYSPNFHTASVSTLHSVYKNILNTAMEFNLRSLVVPPMFLFPGDFPPEAACHLVLRTFRRYFENFGPENFVDLIMLTCPDEDTMMLYRKVLPVYFPRNAEEERLSYPNNISQDDGYGGPLIKDRGAALKVLVPTEGRNEADSGDEANLPEGVERRSSHGAASLLGVVSEPPSDASRLLRIRRTFTFGGSSTGSSPSNRSYTSSSTPPASPRPRSSVATNPPLLEKALKTDLSALVSAGFLTVVGKDRFDRFVVLMIAREMDLTKFDLINQVLLYFVRVLEPIVSRSTDQYVFIYCHSEVGDRAMTIEQAGVLIKALVDADPRYVERLDALYVLHADWRAKLNLTFARLAMLPREVNDRLFSINCCRTLVDALLPLQPKAGVKSNGIDALLPSFVVDFDNFDHQNHSA